MRSPSFSRALLNLAAVLTLFLLASCTTPPPQQVAATQAVCDSWQIVPSPNPANIADELKSVFAVSSDNIWAVGSFVSTSSSGDNQTLIEHWNGTTWSVVSSPNLIPEPNGYPDYLSKIAGSGPDDLWAVGASQDGFLEHWNGSAWSVVNTPTRPASVYSYTFASISARSPTDVWVVGASANRNLVPSEGSVQALILHWDGTAWSVVPSPDLHADLNGTGLADVAALAPNNVWAVGSTSSNQGQLALIEHWNGTAWSVVPSPQPQGIMRTSAAALSSLSAIAPNNIWAAGAYESSGAEHYLVEHWDGNAWSVITTPASTEKFPSLFQISALSNDAVWALDSEGSLLHWDGTTWNVSTFPNAEQKGYAVHALTVLPNSKIWLVGTANDRTGPGPRTFIATSCP